MMPMQPVKQIVFLSSHYFHWSKRTIIEGIRRFPNSRTAPSKLVKSAQAIYGSWSKAVKAARIRALHRGPSRAVDVPRTKDAGYVLGAMMGDGWACKPSIGKYRVGFAVKEQRLFNEVMRCWHKWIRYRPTIYRRKDGMLYAQINSKELNALLHRCMIDSAFCLRFTLTAQKGMILGLLDSDGNVRKRSPKNVELSIYNFTHSAVLDFVERVFLRCDIKCRRQNTLVAVSTKAIPKFVSAIGLPILTRKMKPLREVFLHDRSVL